MEVSVKEDIKRQQAIDLLINKDRELARLPKKADFSEEEVCFIKQKLGPWPRALETAGLKEKTKLTGREKSKIKRKRIKKGRRISNE